MKIIIADDHAVVRKGLRQILLEEFPFATIKEAGDSEELIKLVMQEEWNLVLTDLTMPGRSGLESLQFIKQHFSKLPVLVLSVHSEDQYAIRALKAGAAGYLNKNLAPEELINAVRSVLSGKKYITRSVAEQLVSSIDITNKMPHETLSDREFEVFKLLVSGKSVTGIADQLALSVTTVSTYRSRILQKMNLATTTALIQYAIENKLI